MTAAAALSMSSRRIRRRPPSARRALSAAPASSEDQRSSTMLTGSLKRRSSSLANRRAAGASAPGVPSTLYGAPTTRRRGLRASISRAIAGQSGPALPNNAAGRGAAVAVSVSPAAMPMRLSPKSKARTASTGFSGMPGDQAQPVDIDAEEPPGAGPALLVGQLEDHAHIDGHGGPGVFAHLALELAGFPARVAESDERIARTFAAGHRGEHVTRGRDLDRLGHLVRVVPLPALPLEHEAPVGMHRAPPQHRLSGEVLRRRLQLHLREHVREAHRQRLVENDAERAAIGVLADQRHGLREVRIEEGRHRDQQVVGEAATALPETTALRGPRE